MIYFPFSIIDKKNIITSHGIKSFILFPKIADNLKTNYAEESYNINGLVPRALQMIKSKFPEVVVCTDVALDPYSNQVYCCQFLWLVVRA